MPTSGRPAPAGVVIWSSHTERIEYVRGPRHHCKTNEAADLRIPLTKDRTKRDPSRVWVANRVVTTSGVTLLLRSPIAGVGQCQHICGAPRGAGASSRSRRASRPAGCPAAALSDEAAYLSRSGDASFASGCTPQTPEEQSILELMERQETLTPTAILERVFPGL